MERRAHRYTVWLPVRIAEMENGMAVSHNASVRGMLLVTASQLEVGSALTIIVQMPPEGTEETHVHGRVVRVEPNTDDPESLWPYRIAVEFDDASPELERALTSLVEAGLAKAQR